MSDRLVKPLNEYSRGCLRDLDKHTYTPDPCERTVPNRTAVIPNESASEGSLCFRGSGDRRIARLRDRPDTCTAVIPRKFSRTYSCGRTSRDLLFAFGPGQTLAFRGRVKAFEGLGAAPFGFKGAVFLMVLCLQPRARQRCRQPAVILSEPASRGSLCFRGSGDRRVAPLRERPGTSCTKPHRCHHEEVRPHVFMRENNEGSAFALTGSNPSRLEIG